MSAIPEVEMLKAANRAIDNRIDRLRRQQTENNVRIDDLNRATRPNFPTPEQREALLLALAKIDEGWVPKSHLGDPVIEGDYGLVVHPLRRWLSIRHRAPYSARGSGKLWHFTDEEDQQFFDIINEAGYAVVQSWPHDEGLSIIVGWKGSA